MVSTTTGPRRLPTWTVPEGVFESLTTWGPAADAASSSAQNTAAQPMRTSVYSIGPAGAWTVKRSPFLRPISAEPTGDSLLMRPSRGAASAEPTMVKVSSPSPPLMTTFEPMPTLVAVGLLDHLRVAELQLERGDAALQEGLLLLGVLVLGVLGQVAVELRLVDARGDARTVDGDELVELGLELREALGREVDRLGVHDRSRPLFLVRRLRVRHRPVVGFTGSSSAFR